MGGLVQNASWVVGSIAVRSGRLALRLRYPSALAPSETISLLTADGSCITGSYWAGRRVGAPAVLIVHGLAACRRVIAPNAAWLAAQGYAVMTIDLRGHGDSARALHSFGWHESLDVHAAFAWLKRRQRGAKVAVVGISMGGAAMLIGARGPVEADAFVLQAVFADIESAIRVRIARLAGKTAARRYERLLSAQCLPRFGVEAAQLAPIKVLPSLRCPVLVIGGETDGFVPPQETRALYDAAPEPKKLWIAPGLGHKAISDTLADAYRAELLAFLTDAIGCPEA